MTNIQLAVQFFFQIAVILATCQVVGVVARRAGQPQVVAEMIAGVLLGPSLFGLFWPDLFSRLFPAESMKVLFPVSQLGLAIYMFVVGLEFRLDIIRERARSAIAVSLAGMVIPFVLGAALGWYFFNHTSLFPEKTSMAEAMIFLGAAMCITAFPMLARIIHFKKLAGTTMGTVALGAGALDDAAAWCLLALVLASFDGDFSDAAANITGGIAYVAIALLVIRPLLGRWGRGIEQRGDMSDREFVICLVFLSLGAWATDAIGLHAVFGAFVMGAAMPRGVVADQLMQRIQPLTVALLLPLFFTYSGLNTQIALLDSTYLWLMTGLVMLAAVGGKGVACWLAARATGLQSRSPRHRRSHECTRVDGAHHYQHRPSTRYYFCGTLRNTRNYGGPYDADGVASFRATGPESRSPFVATRYFCGGRTSWVVTHGLLCRAMVLVKTVLMWRIMILWLLLIMVAAETEPISVARAMSSKLESYSLDFSTSVDPQLQVTLEKVDSRLQERLGMATEHAAVGVLDLNRLRLAMIHPDRGEYAASIPKIGVLLAYFALNRGGATNMTPEVQRELGLMVKSSSNEMAAKFSRELGLKRIQEVLNSCGLYDKNRGGGLWVGKHYGQSDERYGDPVGDNSHAATVRQLLRFYLMLEQGKLVSPEASAVMREIFASPEIPHDNIKFVKGLAGREVKIIRKWGSWENWLHDTAVVTGPGRHYILVALTRHPHGDAYLTDLARAIDDLLAAR